MHVEAGFLRVCIVKCLPRRCNELYLLLQLNFVEHGLTACQEFFSEVVSLNYLHLLVSFQVPKSWCSSKHLQSFYLVRNIYKNISLTTLTSFPCENFLR